MNNNLIEISNKEATEINGGGWLYDLYRIIKEEGQDILDGFKDGMENGAF